MSRSYKKNPGFSDNEKNPGNKKFWLKVMNGRIRKSKDFIPNGNSYRRFVDRYSFMDYCWRPFTKKEIEESWYSRENKLYLIYMK